MSPPAPAVKEEPVPRTEEEEEEDAVVVGGDAPSSSSSIPPLLQSVTNLSGLSSALSRFTRQWKQLESHLDSIQTSIETRSKALHNPERGKGDEATRREKNKEEEDHRSELEYICESMASRALRKYIAGRLYEVDRLRKDVPEALKRARNPGRLVLDCIGRIYLQGSRAYVPGSPMVDVRRACILLLEFYILSGCCAQLDPFVEEDARAAALSWRNRLVGEGPLGSASTVDALGLVFFLASFGIPPELRCKELYGLLRLSNLKKKAAILSRSPILLDKMPGIIQDMIDNGMLVGAVDLVCAFGLKEKFPPMPLLSSCLQNTEQVAIDEQIEGQCSPRSLKDANGKQLSILRSVVRCLEEHKLDRSELARFNIDHKIAKLGKRKREAEEVRSLNRPEIQAKPPLHSINQSQSWEPGSNAAFSVSRNLFNGFLPRSMLDAGHTGLVDGNGAGITVGSSSAGSLANISGDSYAWHGERAPTGSVLRQPPPSAGNNFTVPYLQKASMGPSPTNDQSFSHLPAFSSSLGSGNRNSGSNMYQFADTVSEIESYYAHSSTGNAAPTATPGYRSSYLR